MKKYKRNINNLDCANCAKRVEDYLNDKDYFTNVVVNFSTKKISYESDKDFSIEEINKIVKETEPNCYVTLEEEDEKKDYYFSILVIALLIGVLGYILNASNIKWLFYIISYVLLLYKTFYKAVLLLIKSKSIDENMLITISCLGALCLGKVMEGMMVIALYTIGKILENKALNNSRSSIKELMSIKENYCNRKENNNIVKIKVEDVKVNDILIVKKGEKIPVDGVVLKSSTSLDVSHITGESDLLNVKEKDKVISGSINKSELIEIKATSVYEDSTVYKIFELLEDATNKKAKTETIVTKISKIYTPVVLFISILIVIILPLLFNIPFHESIYRGLTFLVISCPCAIAISVPLSYFSGIGAASYNGILIKGSNYLDNLSNARNIVFDKTGTLTKGSFVISNIKVFDKTYTKDQVVDILMKGESLSNHPIAKSVMKLKEGKVDNGDVKSFKEIEGQGISFVLDKNVVLIGNNKLCNCNNQGDFHLNINGKHVASIFIDDGIKQESKAVIDKLKEYNIKTYMFTGDKKEIAQQINKKLNIDEIKYEMYPEDKYKELEKLKDTSIFVGDGINDAPVLKRADIGISMGSLGQDSAIEASDIVILKDDLRKIPIAIDISKYTKKIIKENLIFSLSIKFIILVLSIFGLVSMWFAVFADTGVTLIAIINTIRILNKFNKGGKYEKNR